MRLVPKSGISGATEGDIYANSNGILYYRSNSTWAAMNSAADYSELIVPLDFKKEVHDGTGYYTGEIGAAQIIVLNGEGYYERSSKPYDAKIAGIESGNRGLYDLREGSTDRREGQRQLGLIGHVKLQVTNENGLIKPGDFITTSSTPGAGMKATRPGRVVGIAKESAESHLDIIEVYLQPHTWL